ncbi:deoxyguanosinetriphosphate triphosphohydrolase [Rickettsiales bacterium]|nr:deoxyguanosinetriphosphate triphosphohydrolase [Rickettsiales bacterium]
MIDFKVACYGVNENDSRGRHYQEDYNDSKYRSVFGRDRDRIINSSAFRRLQYKTQVFVNHKGDHYRTRLTHSLEVAQIARWIAGALKVNKDLAEIVALAHDIGHPPFGHAGEEALNAKMLENGGFSHNAHTLKLVTKIENKFIDFTGLNLSWEMLEGIVKHNGPIIDNIITDQYIYQYSEEYDLELKNHSSLEAQISAISDDIAYNNHDIEDGIRANLFDITDLYNLPLIGDIYQDIIKKYPNIKKDMLVGEAKKRITLAMVVDVIENVEKNIKKYNIKSVADVRKAEKQIVEFSDEMEDVHKKMKLFLINNMYRHSEVNKMTAKAFKVINSLFDFYSNYPDCLPKEKLNINLKSLTDNQLAILISDYIAGMTDRYAIKEYEQLI